MSKPGTLLTRLKGRIMRPVADAAGDRRGEAKAGFEAATGAEPDEDTLEAVEQDVRARHGDIAPEHEGSEPDGRA